jgi:hypothetical protein
MATWNSDWENLPKNSQSPTEIDDAVRAVKGAVSSRMTNEHDTFDDATGGAEALDWRHKEGSARCWYESAEPANAPSAGALAAGHLWWDSDDDELYCYDGASFEPLNAATADISTYIDDQAGGSDLKTKVIQLTYVASELYRGAHGLDVSKIRGVAIVEIDSPGPPTSVLYGPTASATYISVWLGGVWDGDTIYATIFYVD